MATEDSPRKRPANGTQRRHNKPLIEKRRRARINECLSQLQSLVLKATTTEGPRPSKLEKADILEMTVDYIKKTRSVPDDAPSRVPSPGFQQQYVAGYEKCVKEVMQFLETHNNITHDIRAKITTHCQDKLQEKAQTAEPMEGIKWEKSDDESDHQSASESSSPDIAKSTTPVDVIKQEERLPVQNTAYVTPLLQQPSPETSPVKQATLEQVSGPIKLVCGGDILILLDSASTPNIMNPPTIPKIHFGQPSSVQPLPEAYQACNVNMTSGSVAPATIPYPVYRLSNIPVAGIPFASAIPTCMQPIQVHSHTQNKLQLPLGNIITNGQPVAENCHVAGQQTAASMWRPW
ncbi:transcription factor HES-1-B-like isoform X1 [Haliotis cracherodii]|uniref:transcription factor HES-1-B-like isoform X1 n=1 Tax=Haliotis cracherodii TaxID=6455 RepID=UPI0039EA6257